MPQYPVSDQQGIIDGLNYVLSGPGSLGQNFQGYSSSITTALTDEIFNFSTGLRQVDSPIVTNALQYYLTDCEVNVGVNGNQDRVIVNGQINVDFDYTTLIDTSLEYTVAINRYRAYPNTSNTVVDYLYYFEETLASYAYNYGLSTSENGLTAVTATGTKIAYTLPATGSLTPAVDVVLTGVNATTGTGLDAVIQIQIAYGSAGSYNDTNTKVTVLQLGSDWTVGDTIVIPGTSLGGATPANDLTLTVTQVSSGSGPTISQETIFTGIIDEPTIGYYLYVIELQWYALTGALTIDTVDLGVRSISAQVAKP